MNRHFEQLVERIARLPGIGPRHATRIGLFLLNKPQADLEELAASIGNLTKTVRLCQECFNISDHERCPICRDEKRNATALLVVEKVSDLQAVERSGAWQGRYHVLGGTIDPVGRNAASHVRIPELTQRVRQAAQNGTLEVILATGTDAGGEATAQYIKETLADINGITVTRMGRGLATGAHLEYADELTLRHSLESRK